MKHFVVKKDSDGLYGLATLDDQATERNRRAAERETARAKSDSFRKLWRERGGYEGALARQRDVPVGRRAATAATKAHGHMPFPGHRHMGEIG